MFSMLFIARTHFKDVFVALLYCAFTISQMLLNNGSLNSTFVENGWVSPRK